MRNGTLRKCDLDDSLQFRLEKLLLLVLSNSVLVLKLMVVVVVACSGCSFCLFCFFVFEGTK